MGYGTKNLMDTFSSPLFAGIYLMMAAVLFVGHMRIGVSIAPCVWRLIILYSLSFFLLFLIFDTFANVFFLYKNKIF